VLTNFQEPVVSPVVEDNAAAPLVVNKRRSIKNSGHSRLKIFPHYHESFYKLPADIIKLYHDSLIPDAISYWENSLRVKYPYFPVFIGR
jgi:hypothetical protein